MCWRRSQIEPRCRRHKGPVIEIQTLATARLLSPLRWLNERPAGTSKTAQFHVGGNNVLLRLARPVGAATAEPSANALRWLATADAATSRPIHEDTVLVAYYPRDSAMVLSSGRVTSLQNARPQLSVNVEPGSLGAPYFDIWWNLVAMADGDDAGESPIVTAVTMSAILEHLARSSLGGVLSQVLAKRG